MSQLYSLVGKIHIFLQKRVRLLIYIQYLACIFAIVFFFFSAYLPLDPDFGWHIRMGDIIVHSGIPHHDPFSYTMPSYDFIDHEWLTNVLLYEGFQTIGRLGLTLIETVLLATLVCIALGKLRKPWTPFLFFLSFGIFWMSFVGIRPQVISWLFLAVELRVLFDDRAWKKWGIYLPLLILFWVNLHGSFWLGVFLIILKVLYDIVHQRHRMYGLFVAALSIAATCVNPYGISIWREVSMQLSDTQLHTRIAEWQHSLYLFNIPVWISVGLSTILTLSARKKISLFTIGIYMLLLAGAFLAVRNLPLWQIAALMTTQSVFTYFENSIFQDKHMLKRFYTVMVYSSTFGILICLVAANIALPDILRLQENKTYPTRAIQYLSQTPTQGNIFSVYNWGGYLIWKLPKKRVFIDGRMPSWRRSTTPARESQDAMQEFDTTLEKKTPLLPLVQKYCIDTFLLPADFQKKNTKFIAKIAHLKFIKIYQDTIAIIYRKPHPATNQALNFRLSSLDITLKTCSNK